MALQIFTIPEDAQYSIESKSDQFIIKISKSMKEMSVRYPGEKKLVFIIGKNLEILDLSGVPHSSTEIIGKCDQIFHSADNHISFTKTPEVTNAKCTEISLEKPDIPHDECDVKVFPTNPTLRKFVRDDKIIIAVKELVDNIRLSYKGQKKIVLFLNGGSRNVDLTSCSQKETTIYGKCSFIKHSSDGFCSSEEMFNM